MKWRTILAVLAIPVTAFSLLLWTGRELCKSSNHAVENLSGHRFRRVVLHELPNRETVAWVGSGITRKGIVLAHGNSSDRNSMVDRMTYFQSLGYSVIAPDLQAHGETLGSRKTFGVLESKDIENAALYLKNQLGADTLIGIGTSLGGASLLYAEANRSQFGAMIVESVFRDIRTAAKHRLELKFGSFAGLFEPLLTLQLPLWTGISRERVSPVNWAKQCMTPTLILAGSLDPRAKPWESEDVFKSISNPKKRWILFDGAKHQDLYAFDIERYQVEVTKFLNDMLFMPMPSPQGIGLTPH